MSLPSTINPLRYIIQRQYKENIIIKNKLFSERFANARNLYRKDLLAHYGCVNAIEFSEDGEYLISGGDDKRILLWSVAGAIYDYGRPISMRTNHGSNIFCLTFDSHNERIFSGGNDDQVLIHEVYTRNLKTAIPHEKPIYGISIQPQNDSILATAGDDGRILIFDIRESPFQEAQVLAQKISSFHSVMFNPTNPKLLVTAHSEEGIALWDTRKPKTQLIHYDSQTGKISGISACFDSSGKRVVALRRRLPPVLYATESDGALCQFYHPQYYNSCTMKTCCFAGDKDNYVLSGSDDFNLYMWKIPQDDCEWGSSHVVLRGHRSIVNQVRFNKHNHLIASSGVEKMIKLWSSLPIGNWKGSFLQEHADSTRSIYTHEDYVSLVGTTERINHDYSDQSINEDAKMMAFFDSLIQREIEGWDSSSNDTFLSDSDEEQDCSKVISKIFRNGRHSEELKKYKSNRITQLISKKKNRLARLARSKSLSYIQKKTSTENKRKKQSKSKPPHIYKNGILKKSCKKTTDSSRMKKKHKASSKYRTRQSIRIPREQSNSLDIPSTSTGITSSKNSLYRVVQQDSDDEPRNGESREDDNNSEANNLISILPTPLNGTRDIFINVLEVDNGTSRLSRGNNSMESEQEDNVERNTISRPSASNPHTSVYTNDVNDNSENDYFSESSSNSDFEYTYTPKKRCLSASDSGCATCPSSSASSYSTKNSRSHKMCSGNNPISDDEYMNMVETFRKRVKKVRMNIRKKMSAESDSN